jgi:hypothetical protein
MRWLMKAKTLRVYVIIYVYMCACVLGLLLHPALSDACLVYCMSCLLPVLSAACLVCCRSCLMLVLSAVCCLSCLLPVLSAVCCLSCLLPVLAVCLLSVLSAVCLVCLGVGVVGWGRAQEAATGRLLLQ